MKFTKLLSTLAVALAVDAHEVVKMDFNIRRGSSRESISPRDDDEPMLQKRDGSVNMELINQQTFYLVELEVGSNLQKVGVLVDTGSSDLWMMSHQLTCLSGPQNTKRELESVEGKIGNKLYNQQSHLESGKEEDTQKRERLFKPVPRPVSIEKRERLFVAEQDDKAVPVKKENTRLASATNAASGSAGGTNTCTSFGSFDTGKSDSFQRNDSAPSFLIAYVDGTKALGIWGHDDVTIGSTAVDNLSFAIANVTSSNIGVLGIGLPGLEVTYSNRNGGGYQYENLPIKMRNQGLIAKNAYSLYLGPVNSRNGSILFGAVDHAKYSGELQTIPILNTLKSFGFDNPIRIEVALLGITFNSSSNSATEVTLNTYGAVLDTGSTLSYLPRALLSRLANIIGATFSLSAGAYVVDCTSDRSITVSINFSGVVINVPLPDLLLPIRSTSGMCYFGMLAQDSQSLYILFGDNVLRNAYVVYDLEDYEIALAPVKFTTDEDIEIISSSIPKAVMAQGFSSTTLSSGREASATLGSRSRTAAGSSGTSKPSGSNRGTGSSITIKFLVVLGAFTSFVIFM